MFPNVLRKANGAEPGKALCGSVRSGLFHLYREFSVSVPAVFSAELTLFFKGLTRTVARCGYNMKEGKEPFEFSLYQCDEQENRTRSDGSMLNGIKMHLRFAFRT